MPKLVEKLPVPPQVAALVAHLKSTGTGKSKLDKIEELGKAAQDGNEFVASVKANVPPGTWAKVQEYLAGNNADFVTAKEAAGRVEVRSEYQSSIPERTVIIEGKSYRLVPSEDAPTNVRQLGGDVVVPGSEPEKKPEDATDASSVTPTASTEEAKSEVAELNVTEAKDKIGRMTSKDKLEHIALLDTRKSVQEAATKRLEELGK